FCFGLYQYSSGQFGPAPAKKIALEFLTGYVVEESLSLDNMFVFVLIFQYFRIPAQYQHRVLFYGIIGALVFRGIFIALGSALIQYQWVVVLFGIFLLITGVKLLFTGDREIEPQKNPVLRLVRKLFPVTTSLHGSNLFVRLNERVHATPLFLTLALIEVSDIIFAVDSVPAVFGITREPLVVYTSNVFAILGLRSMYFLLAGAVTRFHLLQYGLAIILIFVGLKMCWLDSLFGGHLPIEISLIVIGVVLAVSIALSLLIAPKGEAEPSRRPGD
ncbi:MAG: TerC/Alx family metal homeostasis membrane protein, partial [Bryobacteraceae bacterium]